MNVKRVVCHNLADAHTLDSPRPRLSLRTYLVRAVGQLGVLVEYRDQSATGSDRSAIRCVTPLPHVVSVTHEGETILLDPLLSKYFRLNDTGGRIWALLCQGLDLTAIRSTIAHEYGVPVSEVERDIDTLIDQVTAAGIVTCQ